MKSPREIAERIRDEYHSTRGLDSAPLVVLVAEAIQAERDTVLHLQAEIKSLKESICDDA